MDPCIDGKGGENEDINFTVEQWKDETLKKYFINTKKTDFYLTKNGRWQFYLKDRILYRYFASAIRSDKQLVVPAKFRQEVLRTAHDSIFAGLLGRTKTLARIQSQLLWCGIVSEVRIYDYFCHICQKMEKGSVRPNPLQGPYISSRQFKVLATDIAGEIFTESDSGHHYILSMIDTCKCWVECLPLMHVTTQEIAENCTGYFVEWIFPIPFFLAMGHSLFLDQCMDLMICCLLPRHSVRSITFQVMGL